MCIKPTYMAADYSQHLATFVNLLLDAVLRYEIGKDDANESFN